MANPWFRLYSEMVDDEKIRLLAFEDRWHFVALLCCKSMGLLDKGNDRPRLLMKLSVKLGLANRDLEAALLRLEEAELIDSETCQPISWDDRQFLSNTSTARVKAFRERMKRGRNVSETAQEEETDTETETDSEEKKAAQGQQTDLLGQPEEPKGKQKAPSVADLLRELPADLATDFIQHRKALKAPITHTAVEGIKREAKKASMTFEQAVTCIIERGWRGFKAEWVTKDQPVTAQTQKNMGSGLPRMQA